MQGNIPKVQTLLSNYGSSSFDVKAFLKMIPDRFGLTVAWFSDDVYEPECIPEHPNESAAIELFLRSFSKSMTSEVIYAAFERLWLVKPDLIPVFLKLTTDRLVIDPGFGGFTFHPDGYRNNCLLVYASCDIALNDSLFAGLFHACCDLKQTDVLAQLIKKYHGQLTVKAGLDVNWADTIISLKGSNVKDYPKIEDLLKQAYDHGSVTNGLLKLCGECDLKMADLVLRRCGKYVCGRLLTSAVVKKAPRIVDMILTSFRHTLQKGDVEAGFSMAYQNLEMNSLFLDNIGGDTLRAISIDVINTACESGLDHVVDHLLRHRKHWFTVQDFTFSTDVSNDFPEIADLLFEAYGDLILDRYPSWVRPNRAAPYHWLHAQPCKV